MTLRETIESYLESVGYERSELDPAYWFPPDGQWSDKLIPTIIDCLSRESVSGG